MPCYSPLKGFKNTNGALVFKRAGNTTGKMEVACGQCLGCRLDRNLMWAMRIVHESALHMDKHGNCFITLTYRDKDDCTDKQIKNAYYVPGDYSLDVTHFQSFIRKIRRHFDQRIRYFHCGEYGDENLRPHYHACLFNVTFDDMVVYQQEEGITTYESPTLQKLWPYGFCTIGELNFETAAYTSGYILKKINGHQATEAYLRSDDYGVCYWVKSPYITMSLKPGIGADFYAQYKTDFFGNMRSVTDESPLPGTGRIINKVPRYYDKILEAEDPSLSDLVKEMRQDYISKHREDFTPQRLMDKYKCQQAHLTHKKREL